MTSEECQAAAVAMITAKRGGDPQAAADIALAATRRPYDSLATLGFLVGLSAGLLDMLADLGLDPDDLLGSVGLSIARDGR